MCLDAAGLLPQKQLPNLAGTDVVFVGDLPDSLIRRGRNACLTQCFQGCIDIQIGFLAKLPQRLLSKSSTARTASASIFILPSAAPATLTTTACVRLSGSKHI